MELNYSKTIANSSVHIGVNHFRIFSYLFFFSYSFKKNRVILCVLLHKLLFDYQYIVISLP